MTTSLIFVLQTCVNYLYVGNDAQGVVWNHQILHWSIRNVDNDHMQNKYGSIDIKIYVSGDTFVIHVYESNILCCRLMLNETEPVYVH